MLKAGVHCVGELNVNVQKCFEANISSGLSRVTVEA